MTKDPDAALKSEIKACIDACAGCDLPDTKHLALELGARHYHRKPAEIEEKINDYLRSKGQEQR